ncbi:double-stranded RNA-binding protein 3-like [Chenopodium quinoa]|uniref:double-stranded RNA-binding protein 3-like n=1 Tax=Chenopodium quinoa TaxID=63459 RepID=UPI000B780A3D|nr:double-stranded RNA-binding protein 3-like [Chenopodium quinoa]
MFKNQLQELAQRSCFNLPSYACRREGPDHAPRFKASVNFNGEIFESPGYSPTLRQAEHAAAEVALNLLSSRGSKSLTARVLDETGVYKNLLQETAHKAGLNLPVYTTIRTGPGHVPVFTCTVELAGMSFTGESAKTKKQAEKNAAISAWSTLKRMPSLFPKIETAENNNLGVGKQDQVIVARVLSSFKSQKTGKQRDYHSHHYNRNHHRRSSRNARTWRSDDTHKYFTTLPLKNPSEISTSQQKSSSFVDLLPPPPPRTMSKILPLTLKTSTTNVNLNEGDHVCHGKLNGVVRSTISTTQQQGETHYRNLFLGSSLSCAQMGIMGNYNSNLKGIAPAVQIRSVIPVCAAPPVKPLIKEDESSSSAAVISPPESSQQLSTSLSSEVSKLQLKEE